MCFVFVCFLSQTFFFKRWHYYLIFFSNSSNQQLGETGTVRRGHFPVLGKGADKNTITTSLVCSGSACSGPQAVGAGERGIEIKKVKECASFFFFYLVLSTDFFSFFLGGGFVVSCSTQNWNDLRSWHLHSVLISASTTTKPFRQFWTNQIIISWMLAETFILCKLFFFPILCRCF